MIIEIALGIVLAVIILAFLPAIVGLLAASFLALLVLGLVGMFVVMFWGNPEIGVLTATFVGGLAVFLVAGGLIKLILKKLKWDIDAGEIFAWLLFVPLIGTATFVIFFPPEGSSPPEPLYVVVMLVGDVIILVYLFNLIKKRLAEKKKNATEANSQMVNKS